MRQVVLLILTCIYLPALAQLEARFWNPSSFFMEDVFIADSNTFFVTGSNYYATSLNGGSSYNGLSSGGMFVKAAFFSSVNFGIAVGNDGKYRTNSNCAYFWGWGNNKYIGQNVDLFDAYFINDHKGVVCGESGSLYISENQAASFSFVETGVNDDLKGVHMINDSVYFAVGYGGQIIKMVGDSVFVNTLSFAYDLNKVFFPSDQLGFAVGNDGILLRTEDQGNSWTSIGLETSEDILNIDFIDEENGLICGTGGKIWRSEDGGISWGSYTVLQEEEIRAIGYVNEDLVFAVGSQFVLHSYDGGSTWLRVNGELRSIDFPTDSVGYSCAYRGVAHRTKDGGRNWESMNLNTLQYLNDVNFMNPDTGFIVGGSEVFRTHDGGDSWSTIANPSESSLYSIDFWGYDKIIAVGYRFGILVSSDGGESWSYDYNWSGTQWYLDVQFTSENTAYLCSSTGAILKTTDGGSNWSNTPTGTNNQLAKLFFLDDDLGWACGLNGTIIKTEDGGDTWEILDSGTDALYLNGIHFVNADTGFVAGSDGTYLTTYNGGITWINNISGYGDYSDLTMSPNGTIWATANGVIFNVAQFSTQTMQYALCSGSDQIAFYGKQAFHNNDSTRNIRLEIDNEYGDYSSGTTLFEGIVDSVILIQAPIPDYLEEGVYKYRISDNETNETLSIDRYFKVTNSPEVNVTLIDSLLIATADQEVNLVWYYRESPDDWSIYVGNTDTIQVDSTGQYWVQATGQCCETQLDWFTITECNGMLLFEDSAVFESTYTLCNGDSLWINDEFIYEEGIYIDSLVNTEGCDSILISEVTLIDFSYDSISIDLCFGDTYTIGETVINESGIYQDTLISAQGCDSIIYLQLLIRPLDYHLVMEEICLGDTVYIEGSSYYESGIYLDTLINQYGCDSIISLQLNVEFQGDSIQEFSICEGDSILIGENFYHSEGNYIDSSFNSIGCLTVFYSSIYIIENPNVNLGSDTLICESDILILDAGEGFESYFWSTEEISSSIEVDQEGLYWVEVTNENGCLGSDSVQVWVEICSEISELSDQWGIQLYPNPSSGNFYINCQEEGIILDIFSVNGENVQSMTLSSSQNQISLEQKGVYILRFSSGQESFQLELIIQ